MASLVELLKKYQAEYASVIPFVLQHGPAVVLDLTGHDKRWLNIDVQSPMALAEFTQQLVQASNASLAIGRYGEDRTFLYRRSELFAEKNSLRSVHLGIDLTVPVNTAVFTPLPAYVKSVQNNSGFGNYGPTVILQHQLEDKLFYTLYGHLSATTLTQLSVDKQLKMGEQIGTVGDSDINGGWPPHLHFQIIEDLWGNWGDFPGVIDVINKDKYLQNCPDPNLILQIKCLQVAH